MLASAARRPGNGYTALHFAAIADAADLIARGRFDEFRKSVDVLSSEGETKPVRSTSARCMGIWKQ